MSRVDKLLEKMRTNPRNVRFAEAMRVAWAHFGSPRVSGSHHIFTVPGRNPVNLPRLAGGMAKSYQIEQLLRAIDSTRASPLGRLKMP